jgi:hypothetical protein
MKPYIDIRARIRIIYREAKAADADLARNLADLEEKNGEDHAAIERQEAQARAIRKTPPIALY